MICEYFLKYGHRTMVQKAHIVKKVGKIFIRLIMPKTVLNQTDLNRKKGV